MDQAGIIRDLLVWLESHLDQPLSLDNVALKAGYSKWHLQRMFKDVTGHAIGAYIRARRLSKAAVALRLTSRPILDIALQYRFDSQQTFTRAFKKQFNQTMRIHFWKQFLLETDTIPPVLYGLHQVRASQEKDDEQEILYTTAVPSDQAVNLHSGQSVLLEAGDYVQFTYNGPRNELQDFILLLYGTCMPTLGLTRRQGQDIERFITHGGKKRSEPPKEIRCEYLIPIRHQQAN
ncbi:MAG: helix-turn-helix domain-containing protein [Pantoea sp.]|nr:helix-turn-helix domain-containing protein [Pantoea sp.]